MLNFHLKGIVTAIFLGTVITMVPTSADATVCLFRTQASDQSSEAQYGEIVPLCNDGENFTTTAASCNQICDASANAPDNARIYGCILMRFNSCQDYQQSVQGGDIPGANSDIRNDPRFCGVNRPCDNLLPDRPTSTPTSTSPEYVCKTPMPEDYDGPLPECAFCGTCRGTDHLVLLMINIGKFILSLLGTIAFVMFIYGGVTMIMSFGSTEKFKKGQNILVAAVVGVLIALSAYLAVDFILESLQVAESFRVVN